MTKFQAMTPTQTLRLTTGVSVAGEALTLAADLFLPQSLPPRPLLLLCLPGGAMSRRYFNLQVEGDESFSFAAAMTAQGFIVATLDHPGVGESTRPEDGYALTPEIINAANAEASAQIIGGLQAGTLLAGLPAIPALKSVGVGHSMGAMFTTLQQAAFAQHIGIVLLGFGTRGLPEYVGPKVRERVTTDRAGVLAELPRLAAQMFGNVPYPTIRSTAESKVIYAGANAEQAGVLALKPAIERLLPVPAYLSMLPGNVAEQAAQIRVPVFFGVGENDMTGPAQSIGSAFTQSGDQTLLVLPDTGHNHFVFASRSLLFTRIARWLLNHLD